MSERRRTYTRRDILRFGVFAAGALIAEDTIAAHTESDSFTRSFWETLETGIQNQDPELLRTELEQKYGIRLLKSNTSEFAQRYSLSEDQARSFRTRIDWPAPQLKTLDFALSVLPDNLHGLVVQNNGIVRPLEISLVDSKRTSSADTFLEDSEADIQFERNQLGATIFERKTSTKVVAHEATHIFTVGSHFKAIEKDLRENLSLSELGDLRKTFRAVISEYDTTNSFYNFRLISWSDPIGYGASTFHEFWSVAAENYLDGEANFVQEYKRFMGDQRAKLLYESVKSGIFRGWEYKQGSPINFSGPFKS